VTTLAICSTFVGFGLGTRFRFLILLPITFLGSMFLLVLGMALGHPLLSLVASIVVFAFFLQFGYVAAALFKYSVGPVLAARGRTALGSCWCNRSLLRQPLEEPAYGRSDVVKKACECGDLLTRTILANPSFTATHPFAAPRFCPIAPTFDTEPYATEIRRGSQSRVQACWPFHQLSRLASRSQFCSGRAAAPGYDDTRSSVMTFRRIVIPLYLFV